MSSSLTFQTIVGGVANTSGAKTNVDDGAEIVSPGSVLAAQPATLAVRVSNTAGTLTMTNSNHGVVTGQRIDLYWSGGACFGVTAGTVSGTSIPFTIVQGGSALPATTTAISVGICYSVPFMVTGDNLSGLVCSRATALCRCYFVFLGALNVLNLAVLNQSGTVYVWDGTNSNTGPQGSGNAGFYSIVNNPLANCSPTQVWVSHENQNAPDSGLIVAVIKH